MADIHAMELLVALHKVEERGAVETADRVLMLARQVWRYWLPTTGLRMAPCVYQRPGSLNASGINQRGD